MKKNRILLLLDKLNKIEWMDINSVLNLDERILECLIEMAKKNNMLFKLGIKTALNKGSIDYILKKIDLINSLWDKMVISEHSIRINDNYSEFDLSNWDIKMLSVLNDNAILTGIIEDVIIDKEIRKNKKIFNKLIKILKKSPKRVHAKYIVKMFTQILLPEEYENGLRYALLFNEAKNEYQLRYAYYLFRDYPERDKSKILDGLDTLIRFANEEFKARYVKAILCNKNAIKYDVIITGANLICLSKNEFNAAAVFKILTNEVFLQNTSYIDRLKIATYANTEEDSIKANDIVSVATDEDALKKNLVYSIINLISHVKTSIDFSDLTVLDIEPEELRSRIEILLKIQDEDVLMAALGIAYNGYLNNDIVMQFLNITLNSSHDFNANVINNFIAFAPHYNDAREQEIIELARILNLAESKNVADEICNFIINNFDEPNILYEATKLVKVLNLSEKVEVYNNDKHSDIMDLKDYVKSLDAEEIEVASLARKKL